MTTNELKVKKWLERFRNAYRNVRHTETLLRTSRMNAERFHGSGECNCTVKPCTRLNGTENALIRLAGIEEKYERQKKELENISSEILKAVALLDDNELETVLIHRYLLFHTTESTAELMNCSPETIKRRQRKAIEKLTRCDLV